MSEQHFSNQSFANPENRPKNGSLVDEAFGQGIITVNEYRQFLGLPIFNGGDITINKKDLKDHWSMGSNRLSPDKT